MRTIFLYFLLLFLLKNILLCVKYLFQFSLFVNFKQKMEQNFWEQWSSEEDEEHLVIERRQYKMQQRVSLEKWDETDFVSRLRMSKRTFCIVLSLIEDQLKCADPRPRYIMPDVQLLIGLRFFALGSMQISIADFAGVCVA